jgi:hypothetical protein
MFDFQQGSQLRKEIASVEVDILGAADAALTVAQVIDVKTGSVNDLLIAGLNLKIRGHRLKIAGDNAANGVYFVNQSTNERVRVDVSDIVTNNPSEIIIIIPALVAGTYRVEVVTQYSVGAVLKEPRTAVFEKTLTVQ